MALLDKFELQNELRRHKTSQEQSQTLLSLMPITRKGLADVPPLSVGDRAGHAAASQVSHEEIFAAMADLSHSPADSEWVYSATKLQPRTFLLHLIIKGLS